jgi:hypothetical protein
MNQQNVSCSFRKLGKITNLLLYIPYFPLGVWLQVGDVRQPAGGNVWFAPVENPTPTSKLPNKIMQLKMTITTCKYHVRPMLDFISQSAVGKICSALGGQRTRRAMAAMGPWPDMHVAALHLIFHGYNGPNRFVHPLLSLARRQSHD